MIVLHINSLEVTPLIGAQGQEFTFRIDVSPAAAGPSVDLHVEFDAGNGWWRAETRTTAGGVIELKRAIQAAGPRRVRVTAAYPAVKLTGETRKNFTVVTAGSLLRRVIDPLAICQPCEVLGGATGEIEVAVYYRTIDRGAEGRAGCSHDIEISALVGSRVHTATNIRPADAPGWFVADVYGSITPFASGRYRVSVTPTVGQGRALGRDRVVYIDSATEEASRPNIGPAERATGEVLVFPGSRTRIDFIVQAEETWSARTNGKIATLHPEIGDDTKNIINKIEGYNAVKVTVTDAFRTFAEQTALYNQGRTTPGNIVTHATAGLSYHNHGVAVDVYNIQGSNLMGLGAADRAVFELFGFYWGGNFGDNPHFEKSFGLQEQVMLARYNQSLFMPAAPYIDVAP